MALEQAQAPTAGPSRDVLVNVRDVKMYFPVTAGLIFQRRVADVKAVDGVTFQIRRGETLGLVGESGCGKTTLGRMVLLLYKPTAGSITFNSQELTRMRAGDVRRMRRQMQMIFQDPYASLNPRMTVGSIIAEPLIIHSLAKGRQERRERVQELLKVVGLDPRVHTRYPHEFSGGQRQRIGIARALGSDPIFVICDEPISALDVSIQAQIINLLEDLQEAFSLTYLFIAHDLAVVRHISDRIAVMYLGKIMEFADCHELYRNPQHPYTRALLAAVPIPNPKTEKQRERIVLKGEIPSPIHPPRGCRFNTRCPLAQAICFEEEPAYRELGQGHFVACHLVE